MSTTGSAYAGTEDISNFYRFTCITNNLLRDVYWTILINEVAINQLKSEILNNITKLGRSASKASILAECKKPGAPEANQFDISALYTLLRNISGIATPTMGWGMDPLPFNLTVADDIERIREMRNVLGHSTNAAISSHTYAMVISKCRSVLQRIDGTYGTHFTQELTNIESMDLNRVVPTLDPPSVLRHYVIHCFLVVSLVAAALWHLRPSMLDAEPSKLNAVYGDAEKKDEHEGQTMSVFIHTTGGQHSFSMSRGKAEVYHIQDYHMGIKGWDDIGYNFVVGEDGRMYEGRGWDTIGAHTLGWNSVSISIAVMGDFAVRVPNKAAILAINTVIKQGIDTGKLVEDYLLYGHRDARPNFLSPGKVFYDEIKTWQHYGPLPPIKPCQ